MTLTICLVTKGREDFLEETLSNLTDALRLPFVKIVIVANGTNKRVTEKIKVWTKINPHRIKFFFFEDNDPGAKRVWNILYMEETQWIIFPGDDDLLDVSALEQWHSLAQRNSEFAGFAFAVEKFDHLGRSLGTLVCSASESSSQGARLAHAFHEPPFIWPSLIFNFSMITQDIPNSRYTFDWWVQIQLLMSGRVAVVPDVLLKYRVHVGQESAVANLARKYLEATMCLKGLVQSSAFCEYIQGLDSKVKEDFWNELIKNPPIYGDPIFSMSLNLEIIEVMVSTSRNAEERENLLGTFSIMNNVVLTSNQMSFLMPYNQLDQKSLSNVRILAEDTCDYLRRLAQNFNGSQNSKLFTVSCRHSTLKQNYIIPCNSFVGDSNLDSDKLALFLSSQLELLSKNQLKLTAGERFLIGTYRNLRRRIMWRFMSRIREKRLR